MQNNYNGQLSLKSLFRTIFLIPVLFFSAQTVSFAQCNEGASTCESSELFAFPHTVRMNETASNSGDIPGCASGTAGVFNNTTWFRITAQSSNITIDITATNCTTVDDFTGFQAGMYSICDPSSPSIGDVQCTCVGQGGVPVTVGGEVTVGEDYYIFVDGCAGSVCDVTLNITNGVVAPPPMVNLMAPQAPTTTDPIPTCPGAELTFTIPNVEDADFYTWSLPSDATIVSEDCESITVIWGTTDWNVTASASNTSTNQNAGPGPGLFVNIDNSLQSTHTGSYCSTPGETPVLYTFWGTPGQTYEAGVHNVISPSIGPGCDTPYVLTVVENIIEILNIVETPTTCNSNQVNAVDNGSAAVFMQNHGGGPFSYQWEGSSFTGSNNTQLPMGITGLTITDQGSGCTIETFVSIGEPDFIQVAVGIDSAPSCADATDGSVFVDVLGGTPPYSYLWFDGSTDDIRMDMPAGVYRLTVTDGNGCNSIFIDNLPPSGGSVTATESNQSGETCTGANNGSVTLTGDGAGTFTFTWPDAIEAATRNDLTTGDYEVTISNGSGCTGIQTVTIAPGSAFSVDASNVSDLDCFGDTDGSVTIDVMGGTAPITYDLGSGTVTGNVISGLVAGDYMLTVTDGSGCATNDIPVTITTPTLFDPAIANMPVSCGGSGDGTATVTPIGGTGPYTYIWEDMTTNPSINNLSGGTYMVTVTDDNGCSRILSTDVDGGGSLILTGPDPAMSGAFLVSCPGAADGSVTVDVSGATGTVTYSWVGTTSNTGTASGLAPGMYTLNVEDGAGCTGSYAVTISAPDPIMVMEINNTPTSCAGVADGSAEVSVSGGTGSVYTYEWDNGETTNPAVGLGPGDHTVTVRDENLCPQTQMVTIAAPTAITATLVPVDPGCEGENTGSITVNALGGSGAYMFDIGNGPQTSNEFSLLEPNTYSITVTNMDGSCAEIFTETLMGQAAITAVVTPTNVSCAGAGDGEITVVPAGGVGPYTYLWTDGETTPTITDKNGGGYFVTVTDANMCPQVFPAAIGEPTPVTISLVDQTSANCDGSGGATASISVSGGDGNYTYMWSAGIASPSGSEVTDLDAGDVTVTVEDGEGCPSAPLIITIDVPDPVTLMEDQLSGETCFGLENGEVTVITNGGNGTFMFDLDGGTPQSSNEFTNLAPDDYIVNVTDANGCTDFINITIPPANEITGSVDAISDLTVCDNFTDGSVTITASGGDGDLRYLIDGGTPQASPVFDNLGGGSYTINVIDENNCFSDDIQFNVIELAEIMVDVNLMDSELTICDGGDNGEVSIDADGGNNTFEYTLDGVTQMSNEFNGLSGGDYTIVVTDGNGCTNDVDFSVMELAPIIINLDAAASDQLVCAGANDGSVTLTANGGDNNLMFDIGPGTAQNNGVFTDLVPNTYTATVIDGNMCSETFMFTVAPAPAITAQVDMDASELAICDGETDGSVTIDANGGDGDFMYTLGGVTQASPTFENLAANDYTGTVSDGNGCSQTVDFTVAATTAITANITASDLTVCNGFADGSVTITAAGGDNDFTFNLGGTDQVSNVFDGLAPGPHTVMITDGNGCTTTPVDFTVIESDEITTMVDGNSDLLVCDGLSDGSIIINAAGGTGSFMYSLNNGTPQANNEFAGLGEGDYEIVIIDSDGCNSMLVDFAIVAAAPVTGVIDPASELSICNGETIGSVTINGSGGDGDLMYILNNGMPQASNVFNGLTAGNYAVDIIDGNNCTTAAIPFDIVEADLVIATEDPNSDLVNCFGDSDGSVIINAAGGSGGFMYDIGNGPQPANTFDNLAPGDYSITVTDMNNCTSAPVEITVVEAEVLGATLTIASSDLTVCSGEADATAAIEVTGGDGNYTYTLDNNPAQDSNIFNGLGEGDYVVTVIDGNGCEQTVPVMVEEAPAISYTIEQTDVNCFGQATGEATVNILLGDSPFEFAWSSNMQVTQTAQQLAEGIYTVTITDGNLCETIETVTITQPVSELAIDNLAAVIQPATCGDTNGSVSISVNGGTAPYTYQWSDNMTTSADLNLVGPGSYTVTVTDANMCSTVSTNYSVSEPGALEVNPTANPVLCNGDNTGSISLSVNGGTAPYTFVWSDIATDTPDRNSLPVGMYTVEVSDASGCVLPALNINITQPAALTTLLTPSQASCGTSDGSVSLLVEGGTGVGTYTYEWLGGSTDANLTDVPAGIYDVTVTDQNMCSVVSLATEVTNPGTPDLAIAGTDVTCFGASTGTITLDITGGSGGNTITWSDVNLNGLTNPTNLPAGDYFVTVTDVNMCASTEMITITEPVAPLAITEIQVNQATCGNANGSVTVDVTGGTGNYVYNWSDGTGTTTVSGLTPGIVTLEIIDDNMCATTATYNVSEPDALQVDIAQTTVVDASCNAISDGSIDVTVTGGTGPGTYIYEWADGFGASEDLAALPAGTYSLLITDAAGCEFTYETTIGEPAELTVTSTAVMANCGQSNGAVNVTVNGGTEPYNFVWSDGITTSEDLNNAPADSYFVTITDNNGCEIVHDNTIGNPNPPTVGILSTDVTCNSTATGTALLEVTGGSGVYTYEWSDPTFNGQDNPTTLPANTYTVTVSDNLNCSTVETFEITEPTALVLNIESVIEATCGEANGSVAIEITGGTVPYEYNWDNGADTEDLEMLTPGNYTLNFMDGNGCTLNEIFEVSEPDALQVDLAQTTVIDATCNGTSTGSIDVTVTGGTGPGTYIYEWADGFGTNEDLINLPAGTYTVTVTDDNCSFVYTETITEPAPIMISGTTEDAVCGQSNGSINLTVTGGTGNSENFTYTWDNGAAPVQDPNALPAGQYNVTVTDENGCEAQPFDISVTSPNAPEIEVASAPVSCNGANDGSIDLTVSGGTGEVTIIWDNPVYNGQTSVNDLAPGVYQITAEDEDGCTFPVNVTIEEPLLLEAFVIDPQASTRCNSSADGSIELTVQGGTGDVYSYQWTNGAGNVQNPENLTAGLYEVIVTDDNGCTATESVTIIEPDAILLTADPTPASCSNTADGAIEISANGGTGDFTYEWNDGLFATEDITDLQPGNYNLAVSDQNGCNETIEVTVSAPEPVVVNLADVSNFSGFNTTCNESEDGFITVSAEGGNTEYSYAWADGTNGPTISEIGQGSYSVIVTDQEGCTGENNFSLDAPAPIIVDLETDEPACFGDNNGVIIINGIDGGRQPYRYSLNNGDYTTEQFFGNLVSGTYSLAVEDANGCTNELDVVVDEVNQVTVSLFDDPVVNITLGDSITLAPQSNIPLTDSTYTWSVGFDGDTLQGLRPVVRPLNNTSYAISVTDEFGCTTSDEVLIEVTKPRSIYIPNAFHPNAVNGNNLFMIYGGQDVSIVRSLEIYNRWGEVVYSDLEFPTDTPSRGSWDGTFRSKISQTGVYVYIIKVEFIDGETKIYTGDVTLLR